MMMRKWIPPALLTLALCGACMRGRVYDHYNPTPLTGWDRTDTLSFDMPPLAQGGLYATDLGLRTNDNYPFTAVTLIVNQKATRSGKQQSDTVTCRLVDSKGNSRGRGVNYHQYLLRVSQMVLSDSDSLHVTVNHYMKRDVLTGISDVGIAVSRLK